MNLKSKKKLIGKIIGALWWVFVILLALVLVKIMAAKMSGKVPTVFNYSVIYIVSGSMEDEIPRNSYILIKKVDADEVKRDDIICFYSTDPSIYGLPNTHRVVEDPIVTEQGIEFVTRGDANPANDTTNAEGDRLIGVYVKRLEALDKLTGLISGKGVIIVIFGLQIVLFSLLTYNFVVAKHGKKEDEESSSDQDGEGGEST